MFHDDEDKRRRFEALLADDIDGAILTGAIVGVVLWMAKCIMDLDDAVADWLEEERLPRLMAARWELARDSS